MPVRLTSKAFKTALAAVVVLSALLIMMPAVTGYIWGLSRVLLFIGAALASAYLAAIVFNYLWAARQKWRQ